jgi:uncharacterized protein (TIGR02611 family)
MQETSQTLEPAIQPPRSRLFCYAWRIGVGIVGGLTLLLGFAMVIGPGPGWLVVWAGVSILATEFPWARRLARWLRIQGRKLINRYWKRRDKTPATVRSSTECGS